MSGLLRISRNYLFEVMNSDGVIKSLPLFDQSSSESGLQFIESSVDVSPR